MTSLFIPLSFYPGMLILIRFELREFMLLLLFLLIKHHSLSIAFCRKNGYLGSLAIPFYTGQTKPCPIFFNPVFLTRVPCSEI